MVPLEKQVKDIPDGNEETCKKLRCNISSMDFFFWFLQAMSYSTLFLTKLVLLKNKNFINYWIDMGIKKIGVHTYLRIFPKSNPPFQSEHGNQIKEISLLKKKQKNIWWIWLFAQLLIVHMIALNMFKTLLISQIQRLAKH